MGGRQRVLWDYLLGLVPSAWTWRRSEKQEFTRNTGNLLVCVNHPANRHLRALLALATEGCLLRLRLLELKGKVSSVSRLCRRTKIGF